MKTIKNVQLIAFMLVALNVFGFNNNPNESLITYENNQTVYNCEAVKVFIKSKKGKTLYQGTLSDCEELPKDFNWSELADGSYRIEYELGMEIKVVPVSIKNSKVEFKQSYKVFVPVVNQRGSLVYITRFAFEKQSMEISIYDSSDELVYNESLRNSAQMGRIFDFSQIHNENYKVVVKSDGRTYTKTILM